MVWKVAAVYIATVIGAGFATGREVVEFFARFGGTGMVGVGVATVMLCLAGALAMEKCWAWGTSDYQVLIQRAMPALAPVVDGLYTGFLFIGMGVMFSGAHAVWQQVFGFSGGVYLTALLVFIPLICGPEKILTISAYLVPPMLILIGYICLRTISSGGLVFPVTRMPSALGYSLLYSGYNIGFSLAVFAGLSKTIKTRRSVRQGAILGGLILGLLLALMVLALFCAPPLFLHAPLPMLGLALNQGRLLALLYTVVIWLAMYTTALANGVAVTQRLNHRLVNPWTRSLLVVGLGVVTAWFGFVPLVKVAYPLFGLFGLLLLFKLAWGVKNS